MSETTSLNEAIISEVRTTLARRKLTQAQLAKECGWVPQYLSRRMTGEIPWSTDEIETLATVLDIPLTDLTNPVEKHRAEVTP